MGDVGSCRERGPPGWRDGQEGVARDAQTAGKDTTVSGPPVATRGGTHAPHKGDDSPYHASGGGECSLEPEDARDQNDSCNDMGNDRAGGREWHLVVNAQPERPWCRSHRRMAGELRGRHEQGGDGDAPAAEGAVASADDGSRGDDHRPERGGDGQDVPPTHGHQVSAHGRTERGDGYGGPTEREGTRMGHLDGWHAATLRPPVRLLREGPTTEDD